MMEQGLSSAQIVAAFEAATRHAREIDVAVSLALLDAGGHLVHFSRMDGVHAGTVDVAIGKARTSVFYRKPTAEFATALANGAMGLLSLPNMIPLPGGIPIIADHRIVGAFGVSGAAPAVDAQIAATAIARLESGFA